MVAAAPVVQHVRHETMAETEPGLTRASTRASTPDNPHARKRRSSGIGSGTWSFYVEEARKPVRVPLRRRHSSLSSERDGPCEEHIEISGGYEIKIQAMDESACQSQREKYAEVKVTVTIMKR